MTIFRIGEKARIRKDLVAGKFYDSCTIEPCFCNETMTNYAGNVVVVSQKDGRTGFMRLRKVEDGFTTEMSWNWSDAMLEPIEEEKTASQGFLKVGSVVKIRSDIAKRVDRKNRIWITLNGNKHVSLPVSDQIKESGGETVFITEVLPRPGHMDGFAYRARFAGTSENITGTFDITMFNCLEDWLVEIGSKSSNDETKPNFKVGDEVVIKTTVSSGERIGHITIQPFMFGQAYKKSDMSHMRRKIGTVTRIVNDSDEHYAFKVSFEHDDREFTWPRDAFELYDGDNDKSNATKKKQPPKKNKPDSTTDYSGYTPKSEFCVYDYLNRAGKFVPSEKALRNITKIEVTVMSGDETGCFYGVYNGNPWQFKFDAAESRFQSYDDGSYTVEGRENIEKWINWSYDPEKAIYAEYSMERMRAFKR